MARADGSDAGGSARAAGSASRRAPAGDRAAGDEAAAAPPSFEAALVKLEQVVDRLESGDLELEAALASFEEGVRLTRFCSEQLEAAERRIEILTQEGADWVARPFEGERGGAADAEADAEANEEEWEE